MRPPGSLGTHWVADAYGCNPELLDPGRLALALREVPEILGLRRVSEPQVLSHQDGSVTAVVLIAESHMSLHSFPGLGGLHADLFSCAPFDLQLLRDELKKRFGVSNFEETLVERRRPGWPNRSL